MYSVPGTPAGDPADGDPARRRQPVICPRAPGWMAIVLLLGIAAEARADREHTVAAGQTLSGIAARYGVRVSALSAANGLADGAALRPGQVLLVPAPGVVYVRAGDTLADIARRHEVSTAELARVNRLPPETGVRIGQRLLLPGYDPAAAAATAEKRWGAPKRRGLVTLHRLSSQLTRRVRVLDGSGRVRRPALRELGRLLRPRESRRIKEPHPRLVRLLAQVSDHFGGRPIHVVSGVRRPGGSTRDSSRHVAAQAIDFRIPGVPLQTLRDYCARLDHVGVGYYPRSQFVHLDVRRRNARWTDDSGPGEAPRVQRPGADGLPAEPAVADEPAAEDDGLAPIEEPGDVPAEKEGYAPPSSASRSTGSAPSQTTSRDPPASVSSSHRFDTHRR